MNVETVPSSVVLNGAAVVWAAAQANVVSAVASKTQVQAPARAMVALAVRTAASN